MKSLKKIWFAAVITAILPLLTTCGGNDGGNGTTNLLYSVGGTVTGLNGTLRLQNNDGNPGTINADGSFTFSARLPNGAQYDVKVSSKPQGQECTVFNGSGTIRSANVTNIQVVCTNITSGVTLSGKIKVPDGVVIDGSVNDSNDDYVSNQTFDTAQPLINPISVGGYVNQTTYGPCGRFNNCNWFSPVNGNSDDYYEVQLKAGDFITLATGEYNTIDNDLDLYLYDNNRKKMDSSIGSGRYEVLRVEEDGKYFVHVTATSGASNYILTIGADMDTAALAYNDTGILSTQHEIVPGQVIVRFKDTVKTAASTEQAVTQYVGNMGLTAVTGSPEREMLFTFDDTGFQIYANNTESTTTGLYERETAGNPEKTRRLNTLMAIKELRKQPDILFAEPNYIVHTNSKIPNDEKYGLQWNLPMIALPEAWDETTGSDDVIVAVVDSGVLVNHPDLCPDTANCRLTGTGYKFLNSGKDRGTDTNDPGDKESGTSGSSFHGTHVAGIIAARTNNNLGVAGVTWNTKIMPVRVIDGTSGTTYDMQQGIRYAAGLSNDSGIILGKPADIINLSLGGGRRSNIEQSLFNEVREKGIIVIAASGNENSATPSYPASYEGVISVSAVNINGTRASYSNYGSNTNFIDVAAPGGDSGDLILSTGGIDTSGSVKYEYTPKAGTSMAAPHVAGVAALMKSVYKNLTPAEFKDMLDAGDITDITGNGDKRYYGNGLINAYKAVVVARNRAGGVETSGLDVNPRTVNFGATGNTGVITLSKIGTGALSITNIDKNAEWLTVTPDSDVDGDGLGRYNLHVDRSSLTQEGAYTAVVAFTASNGKTVSVSVTVQVRGQTEVTYSAGTLYIQLYRINDDGAFQIVDEYNFRYPYSYGAKASGEYYHYAFNNVLPGQYIIFAGSDRNNDGGIVDSGEAFGAYPTLEQIVPIEVTNSNIPNLDFTTNLILSISSDTMAVGNMGVFDKPDAMTPEFKRLSNIEASRIKLLEGGIF